MKAKILVTILTTASMTLVTGAMGQMQTPPPATQTPAAPPGGQMPVPPPEMQRPPGTGAETPAQEKIIEGEVKSINAAGTEIILTDGTQLVAPPGAALRPGALSTGALVVASYMEQGGKKVMTGLHLKEPAASPRTEPRSPGGPAAAPPPPTPPPPATAPPSQSPRRY